jgi:tetratricopeptide (TPR) repeat protein
VLSALNRGGEAVQQSKWLPSGSSRSRVSLQARLAFNEAGRPSDTVKALEEAVRLDARHGRAWYNLGLARNGAGESERAIEALLRAEELLPADPRIPYARATILARAGRLSDAKLAASRALEINPGFADARVLLDQISRMSSAP